MRDATNVSVKIAPKRRRGKPFLNASCLPTCAKAVSVDQHKNNFPSRERRVRMVRTIVKCTRGQKCPWAHLADNRMQQNMVTCSETGESPAAACDNVAWFLDWSHVLMSLEASLGRCSQGGTYWRWPLSDEHFQTSSSISFNVSPLKEVVFLKRSPNALFWDNVSLCWDTNFTGTRGTKSPSCLDLTEAPFRVTSMRIVSLVVFTPRRFLRSWIGDALPLTSFHGVVSLGLSFSSDEHHCSHSCLGTGMRAGELKHPCRHRASSVHWRSR